MKPIFAMLAGLLLAACSGYPYAVRDGGDGVYYAESPPVYTYVDGYFGFPYYGPYAWSWYYPLWYAPLAGPHYSWYRPPYYWSHPFHGVGDYYAYVPVKRKSPVQAGVLPDTPVSAPLPPPNLRDATLRPVKSRRYYKHAGYPTATYKHDGYPTATYKSRAAAKVYMPIDHSASMPTFSRSRPSSGVSAAPSRLSSPSRVSRSKD
jgi:hypothetical protein